MPAVDRKQQQMMAIRKHHPSESNHPEIPMKVAEEFEHGKDLPEHVRKMAHGGYACYHCGGNVSQDGYAMGGMVNEDEEESEEEARYGADEPLDGEGEEDEEETDPGRQKVRSALFAFMSRR